MRIYKDQDDGQRRAKLLEGWKEILLMAPNASQTGCLMVSPEEVSEEVPWLTLVDKATNKLAARLSSMSAYVNWMPGESSWPLSERSAYEFVPRASDEGDTLP